MKKEFEHKPKNSLHRKGEVSLGCGRRNGLTRITSPLSLSMNVLLSHRDLLKDFYLNSTHSVPSALLTYHLFVLNCRLAHYAGRGWVLQHPSHFFLNIVLCGARDTARYQFHQLHASWLSSMFKKESVFFCFILLFHRVFYFFPPLFSIHLM